MSVELIRPPPTLFFTRRIFQRQNAVEDLLFPTTHNITDLSLILFLSFLTFIYVKFTYSATFIDVFYFEHTRIL